MPPLNIDTDGLSTQDKEPFPDPFPWVELKPKDDLMPLPVPSLSSELGRTLHRTAGEPTVQGSWDHWIKWRNSKEHGIEVLELIIRPSKWVIDDAPEGFARRRQKDEMPRRGLTKAVIDRTLISEIRASLRDYLADYSEAMAEAAKEASDSGTPSGFLEAQAERLTAPPERRRGRPPTSREELATKAIAVLDALQKPESIYATLAPLWSVQEVSVPNYWLPKLRREEYLRGEGRSMTAGPELEKYLDEHPRKETEDG